MLTRLPSYARRWLGASIQNQLRGDNPLSVDELASYENPGLFGPASVAWRVHGDAAMLIGGLRALFLQTLHPPTMAGVADHSHYRQDPWGRLHRTGRFIGATTFGSTATAEANIAAVRAVHARVVGTTPAGQPYEANDPHLLEWVHITEVDSFLQAFQHYGHHRLTDAECDRYVAEMTAVGHRLGAVDLPTSTTELRWRLQQYRPECSFDSQARQAVRFLLVPPVALQLRGVYAILATAAVALLPPWARRMMGAWIPPGFDGLVVRPSASAVTGALGWLLGPGGPPELDDPLRRRPAV